MAVDSWFVAGYPPGLLRCTPLSLRGAPGLLLGVCVCVCVCVCVPLAAMQISAMQSHVCTDCRDLE